jgi:hypothetical protein
MKNSILNYENRFYLNGNAISGVLSVQGNYSVNYGPINTIGVGYNKQVMAEVPSASFSVNKYLLYNEPFLRFTGERSDKQAQRFAGSIDYFGKSFGFQTGCVNSISLDCSVGEVPQTSIDIQVFGDIGKTISASGNIGAPYISVPQVKDIILSCSGSSTNRITQFNYNINCPKKPIYLLQPSGFSSTGPSGPSGPTPNFAYVPYEILLELPIEIDASFNLEVDNYEAKRLYEQMTNDVNSVFSISINGTVFEDDFLSVGNSSLTVNNNEELFVIRKSVGINMFNQSFNDFKLVSQEFNSSADDVLSVKLSYKGYLNN